MSEEVDNAPATETVVTEAPTEEVTEESGKFYDSWSEESRNDPSLSKFENGEEIYKSYLEVQKLVGYKGDIPKVDAEAEEWNTFYGKLGRPEEKSGYELKQEEGGRISQEYFDKVSEVAFKNNLTKAQAEGFVSEMTEYDNGLASASQEAIDSDIEAGKQRLTDEWGDSASEMSVAIQTLEKHYGLDEKTMDAIEANPDTLILLGRIAKDLDEKGQVNNAFDATRQGLEDKQAEIQSQIQAVMRETGNVKDSRLDNLLVQLDRISDKLP